MSSVPPVFISNTFEAYAPFLNRASASQYAELKVGIEVAGERALLWGGDRKLVITSGPVAHLDYLHHHLGYPNTRCAFPAKSTDCLSLDILQDPTLMQQIIDYAGKDGTLQLIPYATTPEFLKLAAALQQEYDLTVLLPESPDPAALGVRDEVETKAGFRSLVKRLLPLEGVGLAEGYVAHTPAEVAAIARQFGCQNRPCLVKANTGFLGIGHLFLQPDVAINPTKVLRQLQNNPFLQQAFLQQDCVVVEEWITSNNQLSPSIEFVVPLAGAGDPVITQVCTQRFRTTGDYTGELVSRELQQMPWSAALINSGTCIAQTLQAMGYVGHFDIDSIVSDTNTLYLVEVNARRTGGTHVHELATVLLGADYLQTRVLLSQTSADSGAATDLKLLLRAIADLLYPMQSSRQGVILTHSGALAQGRWGYVIVTPTIDQAIALQQDLTQRLQRV